MDQTPGCARDDDHNFATDTLPWWRDNHVWIRNVVERPGEGPIMVQLTLVALLGFHLRIHIFYRGDQGVFHNHPRSFISLCLWKGYREKLLGKKKERIVRPWTITVRNAKDMHNVEPLGYPCITLALTTPVVGQWEKTRKEA